MNKTKFTRVAVSLALCLVLALSIALLAACGEAIITLNYNYEGAGSRMIRTDDKGAFDLGDAPTRSGYTFEGWYTDAACNNAFTDTTVKADVTLYAKWTKNKDKFTVTYDFNYDNQSKTVEVEEGATHVVEAAVERSGYRCDGYTDESGASHAVGESITVTGNITLTAKWTRVYTVKYDLNGGTANYATEIFVGRNESVTLPAGPTHATKEFDYWEDNHGSQYAAGQSARILEDNTVFTARWKGTYTLNFDPNGGRFSDGDPSGAQYTNGAKVTISSATPIREGYVFKGWSDGLYTYQVGDTYTMAARDTTLRATWAPAVTVTFRYNSVDDAKADVVQLVERGTRISSIDPEPRDDHYFGGWFLDPECTRQFMFEFTDLNTDTEVFAKWTHVYLRFTEYEDGWTVAGPTFNEARSGGFTEAELMTVPETLRLPDAYEGKKVYGLTVGAGIDGIRYLACDESVALITTRRSPLKRVIIPANWTEINDKAFYCCYSIEEYVFEGNNITRIGAEAFYSNRNLKHINIPNTVTEIGKRAFEFCGQLQEIDLSANSMTDIPELMAAYCYELASIKFPQGLQVIHAKAFYQVAGITQLSLPSTLTRIEAAAFGNYSGDESASMTGALWESYESKQRADGTFYEDFTRTQSKLGAIVIPSSVTFIGDFAFAWHKNAQTITFTNGCPDLTHIGAYAFAYCKSLKSIDLPAKLTYLGYEVTRNEEGVVNGFVTNPGSYDNYDQMQLYGGVFAGCEQLTSMALPKCVDYLPPRMFYGCKALTDVTFANDTIQFNGSWQAFMNCTSLETFTIPRSVVLINDETFRGCSNLRQVIFAEGSNCETIFNGVFMDCESLTDINLPEGLLNIGGEAFKGCAALKNIKLPTSLKELGTTISYSQYIGEVFADSGITKLELGQNVTNLKPFAFANMHELLEVVIHPDNKMTYFVTFSLSGVGNVSYTFYNCEKLHKFTLNDNFGGWSLDGGSIGALFGLRAFEGCVSLSEFAVSPTAGFLTTVDGVLYSGGKAFEGRARSLMTYPTGKQDATYTMPADIDGDAVVEIYHNAFWGNAYLKKIVIASSVTKVQSNAFRETANLEEIVFAEGSAISAIGALAFASISTYPSKDGGAPDYDLAPVKTPLKSVTINCSAVPTLAINAQGFHPFIYSTENEEFAIYVPDELVDAFKAAEGWKLLAEFIKPISAKVA